MTSFTLLSASYLHLCPQLLMCWYRKSLPGCPPSISELFMTPLYSILFILLARPKTILSSYAFIAMTLR